MIGAQSMARQAIASTTYQFEHFGIGFFVLFELKTNCNEHCEDAQVTDTFLKIRQSFYIDRTASAGRWSNGIAQMQISRGRGERKIMKTLNSLRNKRFCGNSQ